MQLLHATPQSSIRQVLQQGLRYGATGIHNRGTTGQVNSYLDTLCPPLLRSLGISRRKCIYLYLAAQGMVHDITDGRMRPITEWSHAQAPNAVLSVNIDVDAAYVGDLDAYDAVLQAAELGQPDYLRGQLARHYWQTLLPLRDIAQHYRLDAYGLVRHDRAPALPKRLHRVELLYTRSIPPGSISRYDE